MARAIKHKTTKPKRKEKSAKTRSKRSAGRAARGTSVKTPAEVRAPIISRDVIEEILVHSAKCADGEQLSDQALSQIAVAANLDPTKVLEVHGRIRDEADEANFTAVFRVVDLWSPFS